MTTKRPVPYPEFRGLLQRLGYVEKRTDSLIAFSHPREGLLAFRAYRDDESVDSRDLQSTRKFLELRGLLDPTSFDGFLARATTSA